MASSSQRKIRSSDFDNLKVDRSNADDAVVEVSGVWRLHRGMPTAHAVEDQLMTPTAPRRVVVVGEALGAWDSSLVNFLSGLSQLCRQRGVTLDRTALPEGLNRLADLASGSTDQHDSTTAPATGSLLTRTGARLIARVAAAGNYAEFIGNLVTAMGAALIGRARYRHVDLVEVLQATGANALGIVTLISYLVGIILAFMGAVQLQQFGGSIYIADLVGIATVREMGPMMTGIIMSGRTGAAFAAQLGSMKVTQEIDALETMGISPMEFLVVPRVIALILMMPLLCLYADFVGILGGATVGVGLLGLTLSTYMHQTVAAITMTGLLEGLVKSVVYGVLIAIAGCYEGFECGRSSSAVGDAATAAVVSAIVMIVVACGIFAVILNILGI